MKKIISLLTILFTSHSASAFAEWENSTFAANPNTITYRGLHDSDSSESGLVHTAFTIASGDQDQLSYLRKNVYFPPSGLTIAPIPTPIDTGNNIANIHIKHDSLTGQTHFAYTKTRTVFSGGIPLFLRDICYAILTPGNPSSIKKETLTSFGTFSGETTLSLDLGPGSGESFAPAISYYDPARKSLKYSKRLANGTWPVEEVAIGTGDFPEDIGFNSDLALNQLGRPTIVCEERRFGTIKYYWRSDNGTWNSNIAIPADPALPGDPITASRIQSQPSITFDETTAYLTYKLTRDDSQEIVYRKFLLFGFSREVVDTVDTSGFVILKPFLSTPSVGISLNRIVISYNKNTGGTSGVSRPYLARGTSNQAAPSNFTSEPLPLRSMSEKSDSSLSFDRNLYPIITWTQATGSSVVAAYCPDFTDRDRDGATYLVEKAMRMNPMIPDSQYQPTSQSQTLSDGIQQLLINFRVNEFATAINGDAPSLETSQFIYYPQHSNNLQNWYENDLNIIATANIQVPNGPPPTGTFLLRSPNPEQYFRVHIFRK